MAAPSSGGAMRTTITSTNFSYRNDGFLEVGGGSARNSVVAYNVSVNIVVICRIPLSGVFGSTVENFRIENNTIVEAGRITGAGMCSSLTMHLTGTWVQFQNNLLYIDGFSKVATGMAFLTATIYTTCQVLLA
jgi:hypothetical protein